MTRVLEQEVNLSRRACRKFLNEFTPSHKNIVNDNRGICNINHDVCYVRNFFVHLIFKHVLGF